MHEVNSKISLDIKTTYSKSSEGSSQHFLRPTNTIACSKSSKGLLQHCLQSVNPTACSWISNGLLQHYLHSHFPHLYTPFLLYLCLISNSTAHIHSLFISCIHAIHTHTHTSSIHQHTFIYISKHMHKDNMLAKNKRFIQIMHCSNQHITQICLN